MKDSEVPTLEAEYVELQRGEIARLRAELASDSPRDFPYPNEDGLQHMIGNIEALFAVYELLLQAGVPASFVGLTHAMQQYPMSVIRPMKELLEQGKVEEALALYQQPRPYCR